MTLVPNPLQNERFNNSARAAADYQLEETLAWAKDLSNELFPLTLVAHATVGMLIEATREALEWEENDACPGCGCTEADACWIGEAGEPDSLVCSWTGVENDRGRRYCSACVVEDPDAGPD